MYALTQVSRLARPGTSERWYFGRIAVGSAAAGV